MIKKTYIIIILSLLFNSVFLFSQKPLIYTSSLDDYNIALHLFQKKRYSTAQKKFQDYLTSLPIDEKNETKSTAEFYIALCALKLKNNNGEYLMADFIKNHPHSQNIKYAHFYLGNHYYQSGIFTKAIEHYEQVKSNHLKEKEKQAYNFKFAYSYFEEEQYDKAKLLFAENTKSNSIYKVTSQYYLSCIHYEEKNYNTALQGFEQLKNHDPFQKIAPYYISQIYYKKHNYDKALEYTLPLAKNTNSKRIKEIYIIIGNCYFGKKDYVQAIEYLSKYPINKIQREAIYNLAYSYYITQDYAEAEAQFEKVITERDNISQNAYYHLADCYIKNKQKDKARTAFENAGALDHDPSITEDALFNYAKLTYESSPNPFNDAIDALNRYAQRYPNTERAELAYNYLVEIFISTKNYIRAIEMIEEISNKTPLIQQAYQKVAYYRALELFNDLEIQQAIHYFDKSLNYSNHNPQLKNLALYWRGEAFYELDEYEQSIQSQEQVIFSPQAYSLPIYKDTHYNLGYAYFQLGDYKTAGEWFRKYIVNDDDYSELQMLADAYNRVGDCYFSFKNLTEAFEYYCKAVEIGLSDPDYSLFQKAEIEGLQKEHPQKITTLNQLINIYPESKFVPQAYFEIAKSNIAINNNEEAIANYDHIVETYPNTSFARQSLLQTGLIYFNMGDNEKAIERYKQVVERYPETPEANSAIYGMKNAYIEENNVKEYFTYAGGINKDISVGDAEKDSLTFLTAEKIYLAGKYKETTIYLKNYLQEFPDGIFSVNAHFLLADCLQKQNDTTDVLELYNYVINAPPNVYTEEALVNASEINFNNKNYPLAIQQYSQLEEIAEIKEYQRKARIGLMRCYYETQDYSKTVEQASRVIQIPKIKEEIKREAIFKMASSYYEQKNYAEAVINYRKIGDQTKSKEGAKAKFRIAEVMVKWGHYEKAQKEIMELVRSSTPHQYWLARSFILLSDIQLKHQKDTFQAKETLFSLRNNYKNTDDDILNEIEKKLHYIAAIESQD